MAGELFPSLSPRAWESLLAERLAVLGPSAPRFRLIRSEGRWAVVEVDHTVALEVRTAWSAPSSDPRAPRIRTTRTWGTLVGAKEWLRARRPVSIR